MPHTANSECHIRNQHQQIFNPWEPKNGIGKKPVVIKHKNKQKPILPKIVTSKTKSRVRRKLECLECLMLECLTRANLLVSYVLDVLKRNWFSHIILPILGRWKWRWGWLWFLFLGKIDLEQLAMLTQQIQPANMVNVDSIYYPFRSGPNTPK